MPEPFARSERLQGALGFGLAAYIRLLRLTNRFTLDPPDLYERVARETPLISAMWHGQHLMVPIAWMPVKSPRGALVSRNPDAGIQAAALRALGVTAIRGSGGGPTTKLRKGGATAMLEMARALEGGMSIAMTADAPKAPRVCGLGIIKLAQMTGRPILATAVTTSLRYDFASWDRASIGLPFGRGVIAIGDFIRVPADADDAALEAARARVEADLDRVHAHAYALVGGLDPGRTLRAAT